MSQQLLFVREWATNRGHLPNKALPIKLEKKPTRVWTLYAHSETECPTIPFVPQHNVNAFLEDYVHDWNWQNGTFRYYSRVMDRPCWLLLEYT